MGTVPVGIHWSLNSTYIDSIKNTDVYIVNGEGSIHHSNKRAQTLSLVAPMARSLGKKAILLNATLDSNNDAIYRRLKLFDKIFVRDQLSLDELTRHQIPCTVVPDLSFYEELSISTMRRNNCSAVSVGDSVLEDVVYTLNQYRQRNDYSKLSILKSEESSPESYWDILKSSSLVITGRFHGVCFCINAKIPFLAIESNTKKYQALWKKSSLIEIELLM